MFHDPIPCRLCAATSSFRFTLRVMQTYEVAYFECAGCQSLQTERPYWLDQAYANDEQTLDLGRAQRNVLNAMLCAYILGALGVRNRKPCLDWGAAEGLFGRLMRDRGFNFFSYDKHRQPFYTTSFRTDQPAALAPLVITAFEVFEHFAEPARDLAEIFALKPRLLLGATECYNGQKDDWWYLSPFHGQHVFFYSQAGLDWIANRFHYRYISLPLLHAFVTDEGSEDPDLASFREQLQSLEAAKDTIYRNAAQRLMAHFMGDAWTHVNDDYLLLRKTTFGY